MQLDALRPCEVDGGCCSLKTGSPEQEWDLWLSEDLHPYVDQLCIIMSVHNVERDPDPGEAVRLLSPTELIVLGRLLHLEGLADNLWV